MSELPPIDWDLAAETGRRLAKPGPALTRAEATAVARELKEVAEEAHGHAVRVSRLPDPGDRVRVEVMGRARWVEANIASAQEMARSALDPRPREEWGLAEKVQARAVGAQVGGVLSWVSAKIIGQFDPFAPAPALYFCAPNVVATERELGVDPHDFRLWVAVHELTHRLQFNRAPWLRTHLASLLHRVLVASEPAVPSLRSRPASMVDLIASPSQRIVIDEVTAIMSVIEGYAEVMMDDVGPDVIPSVNRIRPAFQARRNKAGFDAVMRRLLGMDVKLAQYRDGAAFCRAVMAEVGVDGLNRVWESPITFPTHDELFAPRAWLDRMA